MDQEQVKQWVNMGNDAALCVSALASLLQGYDPETSISPMEQCDFHGVGMVLVTQSHAVLRAIDNMEMIIDELVKEVNSWKKA